MGSAGGGAAATCCGWRTRRSTSSACRRLGSRQSRLQVISRTDGPKSRLKARAPTLGMTAVRSCCICPTVARVYLRPCRKLHASGRCSHAQAGCRKGATISCCCAGELQKATLAEEDADEWQLVGDGGDSRASAAPPPDTKAALDTQVSDPHTGSRNQPAISTATLLQPFAAVVRPA
jgi:hypothetical protein